MSLKTPLFALALLVVLAGCDAAGLESSQADFANSTITCDAPYLSSVSSQAYPNKIRLSAEKGGTNGTSATWWDVQYRQQNTKSWTNFGTTFSDVPPLNLDVHGFRVPGSGESGTTYEFRAMQRCYDTNGGDPFPSADSGWSNVISGSVIFQGTGA